MLYLGSLYARGQGGLKKDEKKAIEWCRKAADLGDPSAITNLGYLYEYGEGGLETNRGGRSNCIVNRPTWAARKRW